MKNNNHHKIVRSGLSIVIKLLNVLFSPFNSPNTNDSTTLMTQLINDYLIILLLNSIITKFISTNNVYWNNFLIVNIHSNISKTVIYVMHYVNLTKLDIIAVY